MTPEDVLGLYYGRKDRLAPTHAIFRALRAAVLNEIDVPLPELDRSEKSMVANLLLTGITQTANRIASTMPVPLFPPLRPGFDISENKARTRKARVLDWQDKNNLKSVMRKRALHYLTYAASTVVVKPNPRYTEDLEAEESPVLWEARDPLSTFPADLPTGQVVPDDCIFTFTRSYRWIENRYGQGILAELAIADRNPDQQITLLESVDANYICLYAISESDKAEPAAPGPQYGIQIPQGPAKKTPGKPVIEVSRVDNRAGRPLAVVAGLISLERPQSMYEGLLALMQTQSKLMALEVTGMMRSIWPEEWLLGENGQAATIVTQADPIAGVIGEAYGGSIHVNAPQPAQFGMNIVDRLERAQRVQAGIPAEYGGESATNTRTDKRGNSILSATIDFGILAAHEAFEVSMRAENRIAAAVEVGYFPAKKTFASFSGSYTYQPADLWEPNATHSMRYSAAGSDADGLVVAGGQRLGIGTMSKRSFMELDPLVDDPEQETERVRAESLEGLFFQSLQPLVQNDPNYITVIAKLDQQLRENKAANVMTAWLTLDGEYKAEQQQAQQGQVAPEAAQPGLAEPGAVNAPPQDLSNLGQLTQLLRHTSRSPQPAPQQAVGA